jgi:hypothetical protein
MYNFWTLLRGGWVNVLVGTGDGASYSLYRYIGYSRYLIGDGRLFSNFSDLLRIYLLRRTIFSNMKTMGENETVGAQVLVAIVFLCVARAFLLFIKVVLLS